MSAFAEPRYDIFARTGEEKQRAYEHIANLNSRGFIEVAVCADCGWWSPFDGDLRHEGEPTGIVCSHPSRRHLITRVCIKPMTTAEVVAALNVADADEEDEGA